MDIYQCIPTFGDQVSGQHYHLRPGSYALIVNHDRQLAAVRTRYGFFLPGGGAEPDETPEDTVRREVREECALEIEVMEQVGIADQLVYGRDEGQYFRKRCRFFRAVVCGVSPVAPVGGHELVWLPIATAASALAHASQAWAVNEGLRQGLL